MIEPDKFFTRVKPLCENFLKFPTKENIQKLHLEIEALEPLNLDSFQSYILLPLVIKVDNLSDIRQVELKVDLINTIKELLSRIKLKELSALKTILVVVLKELYDFDTGKFKQNASEELKLAVLLCIETALQRTSVDILENLYVKENGALLGRIAVTCVDVLSIEKYRILRVQAINCLVALFFVHDIANFSDKVLRHQVASLVFIFLPKIIQTLIGVANGDDKQGENLIILSIMALNRILCLIFEDYHKENNLLTFETKDFLDLINLSKSNNVTDDEILGSNLKLKSIEDRITKLQNLELNATWLGASSRKLKPVLSLLKKLASNKSQQIRLEYATLSCDLVENCLKNLNACTLQFVEAIIIMSQDENLLIREKCKKCIENLKNFNFIDNAGELFDIHIISLPRIIHRKDENEQISEFQFLKGFFTIVPDNNIKLILMISNYLEKFCMCLIEALEFDLNEITTIEEYSLRNFTEENEELEDFSWRKYKYLENKRVAIIFQDVCIAVGNSSAKLLVIDKLMELLKQNSSVCNEIILLLTFILSNPAQNDYENNKLHSISFIEELLQEFHWHLALQTNQTKIFNEKNTKWYIDRTPGLYESAIEIKTKDIDLDEIGNEDIINNRIEITDAQFNVLHTCIILDSIGHMALMLEKEYESYIFKSLNKILIKTASNNPLISGSGLYALRSIRKALKYDNISDFVDNFSHYLFYHINISLKNEEENTSIFDILTAVLHYITFKSFNHIENIILTILDESSNYHQTKNISSYLTVFHIFLIRIKEWTKEVDRKFNSINEEDFNNDIYENWLEILNKNDDVDNYDEILNSIDNEETTNECNIDIEQDQEEPIKSELPKYIQLVINMLKGILKFVSSKDQMHKILSLECINSGLPLLESYENELLPIVHEIWYPFAERFKDKDAVVLNRCFTLLETLAIHAKDFLLRKSLKDVIPFLNEFLIKSAKISEKQNYITQTQEFKLQIKLLMEYSNLIISMEMSEKDLDAISEVVLIYLNNTQPKLLQNHAVEYFKKILHYNTPAIYVKLISWEYHENFQENIQVILNYINTMKY